MVSPLIVGHDGEMEAKKYCFRLKETSFTTNDNAKMCADYEFVNAVVSYIRLIVADSIYVYSYRRLALFLTDYPKCRAM